MYFAGGQTYNAPSMLLRGVDQLGAQTHMHDLRGANCWDNCFEFSAELRCSRYQLQYLLSVFSRAQGGDFVLWEAYSLVSDAGLVSVTGPASQVTQTRTWLMVRRCCVSVCVCVVFVCLCVCVCMSVCMCLGLL